MKVALVLTGHIRTFEQNFNLFRDNILEQYDTDVFINTWDTYGYWDDQSSFKETDKIDTRKIENLFFNKIFKNICNNLNSFQLENYDDKKDLFLEEAKKYEKTKIWYGRPENVISMWYKRYESLDLVNFYNKCENTYDKVILTRPDIKLNSIPYFSDKMQICNSYTTTEGYADIFFSGSLEQINKMCDIYNHLEETINDKVMFCGHELVKWWINKNKIPFEIVNYNIELYNTETGYCKK
jgi:hypothetical protein